MPFGTNIPDVRPGQPVSARSENTVRSAVRALQSSGGQNAVAGAYGLLTRRPNYTAPATTFLAKIKSIANDYLVVNTWDGLILGATDLYVAKPRMLQHGLTRYAHLVSITTVDTQTVNVETTDEITGQWKVAPAYAVGDLIQVASSRITGITASIEAITTDLTMMDQNEDARAWVEIPEVE